MSAVVLDIAGRRVGDGQPCFIVAEAGVNHNGRLELARQLIEAARDAGADAVKFQTYRTEQLVAPDAPKAAYQRLGADRAESQFDMLKRLEMSPEMHRDLMEHARACGILFLSAAFDMQSAELLDSLGVPAHKIPSGEITNLPLVRRTARTGKPMIVSTGMSTLDEVADAVAAIRREGNEKVALLHCTSGYPAEPKEANLRAMRTLRATFGLPVGFSDHNPGPNISLAAVALEACIIEKHFTLRRELPGPDQAASLEPKELALLVRSIRDIEAALGDGVKRPMPGEAETAVVARKSLFAARDIPAGARLAAEMIALLRPGTGIPPGRLEDVLQRTARRAIAAGEMLREDMLQ